MTKPEPAPVSIFKLHFCISSGKETFLIILATIGSMLKGCALPLCDFFTYTTINMIISEPAKAERLINKLCLILTLIGVTILITALLVYATWYYIGKKISQRYKEEYFKLYLSKDQKWIDSNNQYEICSKINSTVQKIESGVSLE